MLDFKRNSNKSNAIKIIEGLKVIEEYKYLGVHLGNRPAWRRTSDVLRDLTSSRVCSKMLHIFYECCEDIICWGKSIRANGLKMS